MADDLTEMRGRQDRLEGKVAVLEATVKEEAGLRAKMDSDLSEMKATLIAHKHSLQALHDTQSDHTKRLTRIENKVENIEGKVEDIENRVGNIENRVGNIENRVGNIEQKLGDVRIGVHAILDLLDTHLARKPRWTSLIGLLRLSRPRGDN
jgi:chromosome segregation ATPase